MSTTNTACVDALQVLLHDAPGADAPSAAEVAAARRHADRCPSCAGVLDDATEDPAALRRALDALRSPRRPALQLVLGLVAALQLLVALAWMLGWNVLGSTGLHAGDAHLARDGAIGVIVAVAGLVAARAPRHAMPMLVMALAAFGLQLLGFVLDENHGRVTALFESQHVAVLVIVAMIAALTFRRRPRIAEPRRGSHLRIVR